MTHLEVVRTYYAPDFGKDYDVLQNIEVVNDLGYKTTYTRNMLAYMIINSSVAVYCPTKNPKYYSNYDVSKVIAYSMNEQLWLKTEPDDTLLNNLAEKKWF